MTFFCHRAELKLCESTALVSGHVRPSVVHEAACTSILVSDVAVDGKLARVEIDEKIKVTSSCDSTDCGEEIHHLGVESSSSGFSESENDAEMVTTMYPIIVLLRLRTAMHRNTCNTTNFLNYKTRSIGNEGDRSCTVEVMEGSRCDRSEVPPALKIRSMSYRSDGCDDNGKIERATRAILNKLTLEKFDALYEQLAFCGISTPEHMMILMREVFEKATTQHHFIPMYAALCARLEQDDRFSHAVGAIGEPSSFRHLLLNQCQLAFEQLLESRAHLTLADGVAREDVEAQEVMRKRRALGNVKFVGQLMVCGMLSSRLLVACSDALLRGQRSCPEALESLAALLTVAGAKFDVREDWQYRDRLQNIFVRIRDLTKEKSVPARVRFLLRDLLDLREGGWNLQHQSNIAKENPMRLIEIKEKVAEENRGSKNMCTGSKNKEGKKNELKSKFEKNVRAMKNNRLVGSDDVCQDDNIKQIDKRKNRKCNDQKQSNVSQRGNIDCMQCGKFSPIMKVNVATLEESEITAACRHRTNQMFEPCKEMCAKISNVGGVQHRETFAKKNNGELLEFNAIAFRRELSAILKDLSSDRNVAAAVRRIRAQNVPVKRQAREFADLLTRAAEESRGPARRSAFAFAAGLAAAELSAFDRGECLKGVEIFFTEVFDDLCSEVPRLPAVAASELIPTLRSVFSSVVLDEILPLKFKIVQ